MKTKSITPDLMPTLSAGRHRTPRQGACFMEFASYLAGERWSDHPACTHPLLAALARDVNDLTSDAARASLMPHVTRVIGLTGTDPMISTSIAIIAGSAALPIASMDRQRALAAGLLCMIRNTASADLHELAEEALDSTPDATRWARNYLASTSLMPQSFNPRAAEAIVHTAVVSIALACVPDADARLVDLLDRAIEAAELVARPTPVAVEIPSAELQRA